MMNYALLLSSILLGVTGQILMKWGVSAPKLIWNEAGPLRMFASWPVLAGLAAYGLSSFFWLLTLKRVEISVAYPMVSLGYVLVLAAGYFLFDETISVTRLMGMGFILTGVLLISRS